MMCYKHDYMYMCPVFDTAIKDKLAEWRERMRKRGSMSNADIAIDSLGFSLKAFDNPYLSIPLKQTGVAKSDSVPRN